MTNDPAPNVSPARPDPALGVFETLLVHSGRPVELEAHLARLADSLEELYGEPLPPDAEALVLDSARGAGLARLRITLVPDDDGLRAEARAVEIDAGILFPGRDRAVELAELRIDGGLGEHKWADRRLLADAEADPSGRVPLIVDGDGAVLEASRANLFAVHESALTTPPTDGRILPGVARARVLEIARELGYDVREAPLSAADLAEADELFLTGSVRGVEPVSSAGSDPPRATGAVTAAVAAALRERWLGRGPAA